MPTKMTLFINQQNQGFSETWYHNSNIPTALFNALPNQFFPKAMAFRTRLSVLRAVRFTKVQVPGSPRVSYLYLPFPRLKGGRFELNAPQGEFADVISTTGVWVIRTSTGKNRRVWFRGLYDDDIARDPDGEDAPSPNMSKGVDNWLTALSQAGFQVQYQVRPPDAGLFWRKISQVNHQFTTDPDRAHFTFADENPVMPIGTVYSFTGIGDSLPGFPRQATVLSRVEGAGVMNYGISYRLPGGVTVAPKNLRATPAEKNYESIFDWGFERFGAHKTGRPFGLLAGKSKSTSLSP